MTRRMSQLGIPPYVDPDEYLGRAPDPASTEADTVDEPLGPDPALAALGQIRRERGISQAKMADTLGVSRSTLSFWESGERHPSIERVREYAQALGWDLDVVPR